MRQTKLGFTLVELLVVMGIILILVSIALPAANSARMRAKDTEVKSGCVQIQQVLEEYAVDHANCYPGAHWERDINGNVGVGPGVIGATPTYESGGSPRKDFYVPKDSSDPRGPYFMDGTPNLQVLDCLVLEGYLSDYPPNPFLRASGGIKSQMANLFLFNPILDDTTPVPGRYDTLDWNRFTDTSIAGESMRSRYMDFGRGHFTYIPLNPVNNTGIDYVGEWASGNYTYEELSDYYKRCKGYILAGWGHSRLDDTQAKGMSAKYWSSDLPLDGATGRYDGFDFDASGDLDRMEWFHTDGASGGNVWLELEMRQSDGTLGTAFGQAIGGGVTGFNIDPLFYGATYLKITGN